jgi:TIR domain
MKEPIPAAAITNPQGAAKPVGVFFSYAREDGDIVDAFYTAFEDLDKFVDGDIAVFRDRTSIDPGRHIGAAIRKGLEDSDYLIVFYTGTPKASHSWTGMEIGYFENFIQRDIEERGSTERKIVSIYFDEPPSSIADLEGISLKIQPSDLSQSRDDYIKGLKTAPRDEAAGDPLTRLLNNISRLAEHRSSRTRGHDQARAERKTAIRTERITAEIVPQIKTAMYDCLGGRVARKSIEQRLIEFEVDGPDWRDRSKGIPGNAKLTAHGKAFELFNLAEPKGGLCWRDFLKELSATAEEEASAISRAIERVFDSAVSNVSTVDNDQLVRSPHDQKLYRVLVTRHFDYYNGRKIVNMYFIEKLRKNEFGDQDTSILLAFINVAARYRFIFLEPQSELSEEAFISTKKPALLQDKIHRVLQELVLIEDESRQLQLDSQRARTLLFGGRETIGEAGTASDMWDTARLKLFETADKVLKSNPDQPNFSAEVQAWRDALKDFTAMARAMNANVAVRAIDGLKPFFTKH